MDYNSYIVEQPLLHMDQVFSDDVHTYMFSPNEAELSLPRLDPDLEELRGKVSKNSFNSKTSSKQRTIIRKVLD